MTIVAAVQDPDTGHVWMGSDAFLSHMNQALAAAQDYPKWVAFGPWAIGMCGSQRPEMLLRAKVVTETPPGAVHELCDTLRGWLQQDGYEKLDRKGSWETVDFSVVCATKTHVYDISDDFSAALRAPGDPVAVGSGTLLFLGAFHAASGSVPERMAKALGVTGSLASNCGPPYYLRDLTEPNSTMMEWGGGLPTWRDPNVLVGAR